MKQKMRNKKKNEHKLYIYKKRENYGFCFKILKSNNKNVVKNAGGYRDYELSSRKFKNDS